MTAGHLNPKLDKAEIRARFDAEGRVRIDDFLKPAFADAVERELAERVPWRFAIREGEEDRVYDHAEWEAVPIDERRRILADSHRRATCGFQYMFDYFGLISAHDAMTREQPALAALVDLIRSPGFAAFLRDITGVPEIVEADAQATKYRAGQYLSRHDDFSDPLRRAAYVMGFTRAWRADWGGMLLFHDQDDDIAEGWLPRFNVLTIFRVPQIHSVSFVAPAAGAFRYSVTGWALARPNARGEQRS